MILAISQGGWTAIGAAVGPLLVFITWVASRKGVMQAQEADMLTRVTNASISTTETMRLLLEPLEREIAELRGEIHVLRTHITSLEGQIKDLGHEPPQIPPFPPYGRTK